MKAQSTGPKLKFYFDLIVTLTMVSASLAVVWMVWGNTAKAAAPRGEPPVPSELVSTVGASARGNPNSQLVFLVFSDFQCPFCRQFAREILPEIDRRYAQPGKAQIVFRQFPLDSIHPHAQMAAEAALCAQSQEAFWPMHDWLFSTPQLDEQSILDGLKGLGLEPSAFKQCLGSAQTRALVRADSALGQRLQVVGTPTLFVGWRQEDGRVRLVARWSGAKGFPVISKVVDELILNGPPR